MLTLSQSTLLTKKIAKWAALAIVLLFALIIAVRIIIALKNRFFPTPPPPPTVSFGKLPKIVFKNTSTEKKLSYSLDTVTGTLSVLPDRAKVYKIVSIKPDLLSFKRAQQEVSQVGFIGQAIPVSEGVYQWTNQESPPSKIVFNIFSSDFELSSPFLSSPTVQSAVNLTDAEGAISTAQSFLSNMSLFPNDIDPTKTKTTLFSIRNNSLIPATSISTAQIIRVDFFQNNIDKLPIYYPHATFSTINLLVSGGKYQPQIVKANFAHQDISSEYATYPIKTASEVFQDLKNGKAYIASSLNGNAKISVRNVFLGYYMGKEKQAYLMPIVIFEGNNGFVAYVSAVRDSWINK